MEPLRRSRSSTLSMSNCAYFASRTPSATFSKSQKTARLRASWLLDMCCRPLCPRVLRGPVYPGLEVIQVVVDHGRDVERENLGKDQPADHGEAERHARAAAGADADRDGHAAHQ